MFVLPEFLTWFILYYYSTRSFYIQSKVSELIFCAEKYILKCTKLQVQLFIIQTLVKIHTPHDKIQRVQNVLVNFFERQIRLTYLQKIRKKISVVYHSQIQKYYGCFLKYFAKKLMDLYTVRSLYFSFYEPFAKCHICGRVLALAKCLL